MSWEHVDTRRGVHKTRTMMTPYVEFVYREDTTGLVRTIRQAKRSFHRITSKYMPHQGARECARRIANG